MKKYILEQFDKYDLNVQDAVKLIFQGNFGGGHLIADKNKAKAFLSEELLLVKEEKGDIAYPFIEKISDKYSRLHLSQVEKSGLSLDTLFNIFCESSKAQNDEQKFFADLKELIEMSNNYEIPLDAFDTLNFVYAYLSMEDRLISHSEQYRKQYSPHYRVIENYYAEHIDAFCAIDKILKEKGKAVICIDGKSGSGKSVFANSIQNIYNATLFHADDYFLPKCDKTPSRMAEVGGNIDYERMRKEIFDNLNNSSIQFQKFDCKTQSLKEIEKVNLSNVIIIEGSYSSHPYFDYQYDLKIFIDIDKALQKERILIRNGETMYEFFEKYWIPMENAFFEKYKTKDNADIVYLAK